jgi:hypothetical protein
MFQVLVKTTPYALDAISVACESREVRDAFVKGSAIFWYHYGEEEDWDWHKGGAWIPVEHIANAAGVSADEFNRERPPAPPPPLPLPYGTDIAAGRQGTIEAERLARDFAREAIRDEEQDEGDERW